MPVRVQVGMGVRLAVTVDVAVGVDEVGAV